ncbi:MAG: 16S rRNA (cytidine(1402)-2'-O)-methyltransferase [Lachnospiraceae bacterium]|nr:16S rRNA (cytidine(1402)-2'-O)-methyltransferase [Lachnospiraceae bacterium]
MSGTLYLCATPIGNLSDVSGRVLDTLRAVHLIACEDTRVSKKLLSHFDIHTPLTSYHHNNRYDKAKELLAQLKEGKDIALVTDAGTPAISDPGRELVALCHAEGVSVTSLPGPSALICALSLSGTDTRRFVFEGFLPPVRGAKKERRAVLQSLRREQRTIVLYEAPHHLLQTLKDLQETLGNRSIILCRELTKKFEEVKRMPLADAVAFYEAEEARGEFVLIIEPRSVGTAGAEDILTLAETGAQVPDGDLAKSVAEYVRASVALENDAAGTADAYAAVESHNGDLRIKDLSGEEIMQILLLQLDVPSHVAYYEAKGMDRKAAMKRTAEDRGVSKRDIYTTLYVPQTE